MSIDNLSIYQTFILALTQPQVDTLEKLQLEVDKVTAHIAALEEVLEDSKSGADNANDKRVTLDNLSEIINIKYVVKTLLSEYQDGIADKSDLTTPLPSTSEVQAILDSVNAQNLELDTDADGVNDVLEVEQGLKPDDVNSPVASGTDDVDLDGLTSAQEYVLGSDPLSSDSDSSKVLGNEADNQVNDALEDFDSDGIPNITELMFGLDPLDSDDPVEGGANNFDINGNGVRDSIDIFLESYGFSDISLTSDKDKDGITDVEEVLNGSDPRKFTEQSVTEGEISPNAAASIVNQPASASSGGGGSLGWLYLLLLPFLSLFRQRYV